jgi:plasmid stabilization system protein ParE
LPLKLVVTAAAQNDIIAAQDWYAERSVELGRRFRRAIDRAVFSIGQNPLAFPVVWRDRVRRALVLDRFPYALYFTIDAEQVTIIACFHGRRDPQRWQERS